MVHKNILSIDFGGTSVKYLLINNRKEIDSSITLSSKIINSHISAAIDVVKKVNYFEKEHGEIDGLAISFNSPVKNSSFVRWGEIKGKWVYKDFKKILYSQNLSKNIKVKIINDAKAALYAEFNDGVAKGFDNAVMLTFGTAIGGAAIIEGKLVNGISALGAELSNPVMFFDGYNYESIKLWHSFASMSTLINNFEKLTKRKITGKAIFDLYDEGNDDAKKVVNSLLRSIAIIIFNTVYIYGQEITVIGGGLSNRDKIINEINNELEILSEKLRMEIPTKIALASVRNKAGNYGAYYYFLDNFYERD